MKSARPWIWRPRTGIYAQLLALQQGSSEANKKKLKRYEITS